MYTKDMQVTIPPKSYVKGIEINEKSVDINFADKKKVALVFISLNETYWPYLAQVLKDCRLNFLPQHQVEYFAWTDYSKDTLSKHLAEIEALSKAWYAATTPEEKQVALNNILATLAQVIRLYQPFIAPVIQQSLAFLKQQGLELKFDAEKFWLEAAHPAGDADIVHLLSVLTQYYTLVWTDMDKSLEGVNIIETEGATWPSPTLMRYHLFLNQEEKLKDYDYVFYLDADMRVVQKISDEILGEDLTVALHPMYDLNPTLIPPYEPNQQSTAFIPRLGHLVDAGQWEKGVISPGTADEILARGGKPRFRPLYLAGGFQGGKSDLFIKAMHAIKRQIDKDFDNNGYVAIWNDESHWNKYIFENYGPVLKPSTVVLNADYVHPDSLIKEYYTPRWGRELVPKIITLTKPFSLSPQAAETLYGKI